MDVERSYRKVIARVTHLGYVHIDVDLCIYNLQAVLVLI